MVIFQFAMLIYQRGIGIDFGKNREEPIINWDFMEPKMLVNELVSGKNLQETMVNLPPSVGLHPANLAGEQPGFATWEVKHLRADPLGQ